MDYRNELIQSLKRENVLLRKDNARLEDENQYLRYNHDDIEVTHEMLESCEPELADSNVGQITVWPFKDGSDYEIQLADSNGTLVFVDAIFEAPFDDKEWPKCKNNWEKCTLKKKLESWWDKNAPDELKKHYKVTMLAANQILPDDMLPQDLQGKGGQLELFKDWKNRIKRLKGEQRSTWYWTISPSPDYASGVRNVDPSGGLNGDRADDSDGVVPACIPID